MWEQLQQYIGDVGGRILVAVLILLGGYLLSLLLSRMASAALLKTPRGQTLASLSRSIVRVVVVVSAVVMALDQLGVPITTVLAGAGILGLAVGFGAQTLVKDIISGFFNIIDGVISVGDVAQFGAFEG